MIRNAKHRKITEKAYEVEVEGLAYYIEHIERTWWLYVPGDGRPVNGYAHKRDAVAAIERYHTPQAVRAHRRAVERTRREIAREIAAARKGA